MNACQTSERSHWTLLDAKLTFEMKFRKKIQNSLQMLDLRTEFRIVLLLIY